MKKYMLRYAVFWLPAFIVVIFLPESSSYSFVARWFGAFFMIFGWGVNTGMAAVYRPRDTLSLLMIYFGVSLMLITGWYMGYLSRIFGRYWGQIISGAFSYIPLYALVRALLDFNIPHEIYAMGILTIFCLIGWLAGIVFRYLNPNPYRPKFK